MSDTYIGLGKAVILKALLRTKDSDALAQIAEHLATLALKDGEIRELIYNLITCSQNKVQLTMYTVYKNPKDYPDKWVIRIWQNEQPMLEPLCVEDTLIAARGKLPPGLSNVGKFYSDDPVIYEVWL